MRARFGAQFASTAGLDARSGPLAWRLQAGVRESNEAGLAIAVARGETQHAFRRFRSATNRGETTSMDQKIAIKQFVLRNYLFTEDDTALADGDSLIRNGIVDSTGMLELIAHLEETYSIKIENAEMIPANLDSIDSIGAFVAKKLAG